METLEALSRRIVTVRELASVVRTLKALSGASIRQYEQAVDALAIYYRTVELGLQGVLRGQVLAPSPQPGDGTLGLVVIGSDQGLCGRFNELPAERAASELKARPDRSWRLLVLGSRVADRLQELGHAARLILGLPGSVRAITGTVEQLLLVLDDWREHESLSEVMVCHNAPTDHNVYRPLWSRLLPLDLGRFSARSAPPWPGRALARFSQPRAELLAALARQQLFIGLFRACAESLACEHAARLASLQQASRNIDQHLQALNSQFQQRRQDAITEELLDIVAGAEALDSGP